MTILEALSALNAYPVPRQVILSALVDQDIDPTEEYTSYTSRSRGYRLAKAAVLRWLSLAPNISQGGQNYNISDEQRQNLKNEAQAIINEDGAGSKPVFGYKGSRL